MLQILILLVTFTYAKSPCLDSDSKCLALTEAVENQMGFTTTVSISTEAPGEKCAQIREGDNTLNLMSEVGAEGAQSWVQFCKRYKIERELAFYASKNNGELRPDMVVDKSFNSDNSARPRFKGCPKTVEWKNRAARGICSGVGGRGGTPKLNFPANEIPESIEMPQSLLFAFDGFGDFSPDKAMNSQMNPINVEKHDAGTELVGRGNGLRSFDYLLSAESEDYPLDLKKQQTMYFAGSNLNKGHGDDAAYKCGLEMQKDLDDLIKIFPSIKRPKMITLGYSNGGAASLEYQERLGRAGYSVDLAITFDPIERPAKFVARELTGFDYRKSRHANTKRLINFYQKSDYGSMPLLKLRSSALEGADSNVDLSNRVEARGAHLRMLKDRVPIQKSRCEISKLLNDRDLKC